MKMNLSITHQSSCGRMFFSIFLACTLHITHAEASDMATESPNQDFQEKLLDGLVKVAETSAAELNAEILEKKLNIVFLPPKRFPGSLGGPENIAYVTARSSEERKLPLVRYVVEARGVKILDIDFSGSPAVSVSRSLCVHPELATKMLRELDWINSRTESGHGHSSDTYKKNEKSLELVWAGSCLGFLRMIAQLPKDQSQ